CSYLLSRPRALVRCRRFGFLGVFELRRDLPADLGAPLLHRLEARLRAAERFRLAVELVLGFGEVDLVAVRLRHVPRRIAEHLDAIAFWIAEIDRPGVAMAPRLDHLAAGLAHLAVRALHVRERADVE